MVMDAAKMAGEALGIIKPEKARIEVSGDNRPSGPITVACMFNPTEYKITRTLEITRHRSTSRDGGTVEFAGTNATTLTTQLFFDDFAAPQGDVTPKISTLLNWTKATQSSIDSGRPCPPLVKFVWGNKQLEEFSGYLKSVTVNYTTFRKNGIPVQAKVDITIEGQPTEYGNTNPTSHAANSRRVHTLVEGENLQSVAYRELGKPAYWRAIAELNSIDDPYRIAPGMALLIPSLADAAKGA